MEQLVLKYTNHVEENTAKWDRRFMDMAKVVASWSQDPNTQVGAVIVDEKRRVLSVGYNGFPRRVADDPARLNDREIKYDYMVHAEANAILSLNGNDPYILYCTLSPCRECAKLIIQAGINYVVYEEYREDPVTNDMFTEAGIVMEKLQ